MSIALKVDARPHEKHAALVALVAFAVAIFVFREPLFELVRRWNAQEEYSHGYFIPVIAAWLAWTRRDALRGSVGEPSWFGPLLILVAACFHVIGELSALYFVSQVAFVMVLLGITLSIGGFPLLRVAFIPIVFLLFAIPMPYFIDTVLSWRLQLISSELGVAFIKLFNIPVFLEGNVIDLGQYKLQVVEACSGLRYLYPLLSLGFLAAYLFQAPLWKRAVVFLSTIPITVIMNSFRIGMVGIIVDNFGPQEADGMLHFFEGWIIFIACAALLALEILVLSRIGSSEKKKFSEIFYPPKIEPTLPPGYVPEAKLRLPLAAVVLLLGAGVTTFYVSGRQELFPDRNSFAGFPNNVADWRGRSAMMEPQIEHFLGLTDYIISNYTRSDGRWVNFYVAYYASQRKGVSPHSPSVCLPGNGWQVAEFERTRFEDPSRGISLPFNRVVMIKESQKQIVYYWFEQRGRKIENEWWSKWYLLSDAITRNRTDGALVRLITTVQRGETEADAEKRLQAFIRDVVPSLSGYLPSADDTATKIAPAQPSSKPKIS